MILKLRWLFLLLVLSKVSYSQVFHNEWIDYTKPYYKFKVFGFGSDAANAPVTKGMVRIPFASIAKAGLATTDATYFQLWRDGEEVPVYMSKGSGLLGTDDYIEFVGEINSGKLDKELYREPEFQLNEKWSLQTDTAAYFLTTNTAGNNKRITDAANFVQGNTLPAERYFMHTAGRYFRNTLSNGFAAVASENIYSSSYDRGEGYVSRGVKPVGCSGSTFLPQIFPQLQVYKNGPPMKLAVNSVGNAANSRSVKVLVNSTDVTTYQMDYFYDSKIEETVQVNAVAADSVTVFFYNQSPVPCDEFRIAQIELSYPRTFNMNGSSFFELSVAPGSKGRYIEFTNFNHSGATPVIYDLAAGKRYTGDISEQGKIKLALPPSDIEYQLVITTSAGSYFKTITGLTRREFIDYTKEVNQGEYLIISNPLIYGSGNEDYVDQYRRYRSSAQGGNYKAQVIDIEQLVDQFAWGVKKHPLSIKNFLRYARKNFAEKPKFVFLVGKGVSYNEHRANEHNSLSEQLNLVPTFGYPASDHLLSAEGFTPIPETPIGRLSAVSAQEVGDYLQKVQQYDSAQLSNNNTLQGKAWMKNVLQVAGANDLSRGTEIDLYLQHYKSIIEDTAFGAKVTSYSKMANPAGYMEAVNEFKNNYEQGASLITYFGHSSSTSLDFNLNNPETYNNRSKYPVFIANGCSAGNHFGFEAGRFNTKSTVSEKFVLAKERGAIGYLASTHFGVINYLDIFTRQFYNTFGSSHYNKPIGEVIKAGIMRILNNVSEKDYFARVHAEEFAFHGDPAIKLNGTALPDYVIEKAKITASPSFVTYADTVVKVNLEVANIGRATSDSVRIKVQRKFPSGKVETLILKTIAPISNNNTLSFELPVIANRDKGKNEIIASIDPDNLLVEKTDTNNVAVAEIFIREDAIRPVFPYQNAIINNSNFKFAASTVNPLSDTRSYVIEVDTTALFNSPVKATQTVTSKGGVIEFLPRVNLTDKTVYYWRVGPLSDVMNWSDASFTYAKQIDTGFGQSHFYQHTRASYNRIDLDSASRRFSFRKKDNNLFIVNSIYPTSGLEDGHFSVTVNGDQIIASACDGPVLQFNVFDPVSFAPWRNNTEGAGMYESVTTSCSPNRQYNFDYLTIGRENRGKALRFFDTIPNGAFVVVRIVASPDHHINTYAAEWAADTVMFGKENTIFHRLKVAGFAILDSFNRPRTFSFVFKKNDTSFTPQYVMSEGVNDRIYLNVNCLTSDTAGYITSPQYGPARAWKKASWSAVSAAAGNDSVAVEVIGHKKDGTAVSLLAGKDKAGSIDLTSINATEYPFIQLQLQLLDAVAATPVQIENYKVEYSAVPEGGLAPNLYFNIPDTVGGTTPNRDTLPIGVAFKNVSQVNFDSLSVKLVFYDSSGIMVKVSSIKTKPLPAGDTLHIDAALPVADLRGLYNLYLQVNPSNRYAEQESFNNWLYKYVYIGEAAPLPVLLVSFDAQQSGKNVRTSWKVDSETNTAYYEVQHSINGNVFHTISKVVSQNGGAKNYEFIHMDVPLGNNYYRLIIKAKDGSVKTSPVKLVTVSHGIDVLLYPNPVKDELTVSLNSMQQVATVVLLSQNGQQLVQMKITGKDEIDMSAFAKGTYLLRVTSGNTTKTYKVQKQ